jgi:hypothetical protein
MAIGDYDKVKEIEITSVSGTPTVSFAMPIVLVDGSETTSGGGNIVIDWDNINGKEDICLYDENDVLLDYCYESFSTGSKKAVIWVYNSWTRNGTVQLKVAYGNGTTDDSASYATVFDNESNLEIGYLFNEASSWFLDVTSNNNDINQINGAPSRSESGIFGTAIGFDGVDDWIRKNNVGNLGTISITLEFWVKFDSWVSTTFSGSSGNTLGANLFNTRSVDGHKSPTFCVSPADGGAGTQRALVFAYDTSGVALGSKGSTTLSTGTWYHCVATFQYTNSGDFKGNWKVFLNGSQDGSTNNFDLAGSVSLGFTGEGIRIGDHDEWPGGESDMHVDDFRFYTDDLNANDIKAKYDAGKSSQTFFDQQPVSTDYVRTFSENLSIDDSVSKVVTLNRSFSESIGINDSLFKKIGKFIEDNLVISEVLSKIGSFKRILSENIAYQEVMAKRLHKKISENISILENLSKKTVKSIYENIAYSETVSQFKFLVRSYQENLSVAENKIKIITKNLVENIAYSEVFYKMFLIYKSFSDNITITENLVKKTVKNISDSIGITEVFSRIATLTRNFSENIAITENIFKQAFRNYYESFTENITIAENVVKSTVKSFSESIGITEDFRKKTIRSISETINYTENLIKTAIKNLTETVAISEVFVRVGQFIRTFSENVGITENVSKIKGYTRTFSENLGLSEAITKQKQAFRSFTENLEITEAIYKKVRPLLQAIGKIKDTEAFGITRDIYFRGKITALKIIGKIKK